MGKRLRDIEAARAEEAREARRWYRRNAAQVQEGTNETEGGRVTLPNGEQVDRVVGLWEGEDDVVVYGESNRFIPLIANLYPLVEDEDRERLNMQVEYVLSLLTWEQQDLLHARYIAGCTLQELAQHGESRQAVDQRVKRAKAAFERKWKESGFDA